jgi:phosphoserine aminotransferase
MQQVTFYPGPSQLYPQVEQYLADAYHSGILSANHRSHVFMQLYERTLALLRQKLLVPDCYQVYFTSSATECWEIIAQSLIGQNGSLHFHNGAFGQKWYEYTHKLNEKSTFEAPFDHELLPNTYQQPTADVICLTQNETSNGTQLPSQFFNDFSKTDTLIAVDVTSSLGGIALNWLQADVWFGSSQKCLGLPSGLGILICSPKALSQAQKFNENKHYNSLLFLQKNAEIFQTSYTPNILAIYLLYRVLEHIPSISATHTNIQKQAQFWYQYFENYPAIKPLIRNEKLRSDTVIVLDTNPKLLYSLHHEAQNSGITLGKGYGLWAKNTFRIANFPAICNQQIDQLKQFFDIFRLKISQQ